MAGPAIAIARVSHRYGKTVALQEIGLNIQAGSSLGCIGPDGVGKSTLLALVAGARALQQGTISVFGKDMSSARARSAICPRIAYLPQGLGRNLYASLSVKENIDFFAQLFGAPRRGHIEELLHSTGLTPFRDRPAGQLSGGMKQKLGLCCALVHDPDLLILDEPTTGVDPLSRQQFWTLIERIRARRPALTLIAATAYMEEAERFDQLLVMNGGRMLATGSPSQLKEQTGATSLEQCYIELLPTELRSHYRPLATAPRASVDTDIAIEAQGLSKQFGPFTAVDAIDFAVGRGEIFGFIGSNGCGKTTAMKMLTGLLPASAGTTRLFGKPLDARDLGTRRRVGYMSQSFSLYGELTVAQNLDLHARLFHLPPAVRLTRLPELLQQFDLQNVQSQRAIELPLGIRQRLSLAVAVLHRPEVLILDEPTSGVDPVARDRFWEYLFDLSRHDGVTIFISTHFMNEAERCDRVALMHAGRILAIDTPQALQQQRQTTTLEAAFIGYLADAATAASVSEPEFEPEPRPELSGADHAAPRRGMLSTRRLWAYARRETLELGRDHIRLAFALIGSLLLMLILGYGISLDVEDLQFAVLDNDQSPASRDYAAHLAGSRYFLERPPLRDRAELDERMRSGELSVALEIPYGYGRDLRRGRQPEISAWVDGAMPYRGETIRGYLQGLHRSYMEELIAREGRADLSTPPVTLASRYRYNQDFKSLNAMVPAVIPLLLVFVPALLMALGVVREKELGSIVNLYVSPATRLEFLLGKQLPYIGISLLSFGGMLLLALLVFKVPLKGSLGALLLGAFLYVWATTSLGLFMSSFTRTQIAALAGTSIATMLPATQFSGLNDPVESLNGIARLIGMGFPTTYFLIISRGVFTKALDFADLRGYFLALATFAPVLTAATLSLLKKQER